MATWQETKSFIASNYNVEPLENGGLKLVFETTGGRSQLIFIMHYSELDGAAFFSPFAKTSSITPAQFASVADSSLLGLSQFGDLYGVLHVAPLANLDPNEVHWPLEMVTLWADRLENQLGLGDDL